MRSGSIRLLYRLFAREDIVMIQEFVDRYIGQKDELRGLFLEKHPKDYKSIVQAVVKILAGGDYYEKPDPERVVEIDHGDYQGTLVFVIGVSGYQPSKYWAVMVFYGSCSGCDTLQSIADYSSEPPTEEQINDYMTLALHIVQGIKLIGDNPV